MIIYYLFIYFLKSLPLTPISPSVYPVWFKSDKTKIAKRFCESLNRHHWWKPQLNYGHIHLESASYVDRRSKLIWQCICSNHFMGVNKHLRWISRTFLIEGRFKNKVLLENITILLYCLTLYIIITVHLKNLNLLQSLIVCCSYLKKNFLTLRGM